MDRSLHLLSCIILMLMYLISSYEYKSLNYFQSVWCFEITTCISSKKSMKYSMLNYLELSRDVTTDGQMLDECFSSEPLKFWHSFFTFFPPCCICLYDIMLAHLFDIFSCSRLSSGEWGLLFSWPLRPHQSKECNALRSGFSRWRRSCSWV